MVCGRDVGIIQLGLTIYAIGGIMGNVGSSAFWTWPIVGTKSQDISACAALILTILLKISYGTPNVLVV